MMGKHGILGALLTVAVVSLAACGIPEAAPEPNAPAPAETTETAPVETSGIENRPWRLASYVNAQAETVEAAAHSPAVVTFEDGSASGTSGCNSFFGSYTLSGDRITMGEMGSTLMACEEALMQQEQDFLAALAGAATYAVQGESLQLFDAAGSVVATFAVQVAPESAATLTGLKWSATALGGAGVVSSFIAGTEVTANFGDDGSLQGNAGCNNYTASYTVEGSALTVGPATTTRLLCNAPEGIMEQEEQYLSALEAANAYRIEGDTLELLDTKGDMVLAFAVWSEDDVDSPSQAVAPFCAEPELGSLAYNIPDALDHPIQLEDCVYADQAEADPGKRTTAKLLENKTAYGEIDGIPAAVVAIYVRPGGLGSLYYLALVQEHDGKPAHVAGSVLGERVMVKSIAIEDSRIIVDMYSEEPGGASCCAFVHTLVVYELEAGQLIQVSSELIASTGV